MCNTAVSDAGSPRRSYRLSLVIPCFNEEVVLPALFSRVNLVAPSFGFEVEVICINDGSA